MLNYQSTSFHDSQYLRQLFNLAAAPEFEQWLQKMGVMGAEKKLLPIEARHKLLAGVPNER